MCVLLIELGHSLLPGLPVVTQPITSPAAVKRTIPSCPPAPPVPTLSSPVLQASTAKQLMLALSGLVGSIMLMNACWSERKDIVVRCGGMPTHICDGAWLPAGRQ